MTDDKLAEHWATREDLVAMLQDAGHARPGRAHLAGPAAPPGGLAAAGLGLSCAAGLTLASTNYGVAHADAPAAGLVASYVPATIVTAMACNGFVLLLTRPGRWVALAAVLVALLAAVDLAALALGAYALAPRGAVWSRRSCRRPSARPSCAIGCMTWTASSAASSPTRC